MVGEIVGASLLLWGTLFGAGKSKHTVITHPPSELTNAYIDLFIFQGRQHLSALYHGTHVRHKERIRFMLGTLSISQNSNSPSFLRLSTRMT